MVDEAFLSQYKSLILSAAKRFQKYFPPDDLIAIAQEGFLLACHTWNKAYWRFEEYAVHTIAETLSNAKAQYGRNYSNLSLDAPFPDGKGCMRDFIRAKPDHILNKIYLDGLLDRLDACSRCVAQIYLFTDLSDVEIMENMHISNEELKEKKQKIRDVWTEYDREIATTESLGNNS